MQTQVPGNRRCGIRALFHEITVQLTGRRVMSTFIQTEQCDAKTIRRRRPIATAPASCRKRAGTRRRECYTVKRV